MPILVSCECGKTLRAPDHLAGKRVKCPTCASILDVPLDEEEEAPKPKTSSKVTNKVPAKAAARKPPPPDDDEEDEEEERPRAKGKKKKGGGQKEQSSTPLILAIAVGAVMVLGSAIAGVMLSRRGPDQPKANPIAEAPIEKPVVVVAAPPAFNTLQFIPANAQGFITINIDAFWKTALVQMAVGQLPPNNPLKEMEKDLGLSPGDFDTVTVVMQEIEQQMMWAVVTAKKPFDQTKLLEKAGAKEKAEHKGKTIHHSTSGEGAFHFVNDRCLLTAPRMDLVKTALDTAAQPADNLALAAPLATAKTNKNHLVAAMVIPQAKAQVLKFSIPRAMDPYKIFLDATSASLVVNLDTTMGLDLGFAYGDDIRAVQGKEAMDGLVKMARDFAAQVENGGGPGQPVAKQGFPSPKPAINPSDLADLKKLVGSMKANQNQKAIEFSIKVPINNQAFNKGFVDGFMKSMQNMPGGPVQSVTTTRMRQIGIALHSYQDAHGHLPPAVVTDATGKPLYSWRVELLPYLDQKQLYDKIDKKLPWDQGNNFMCWGLMPDVYRKENDTGVSSSMTRFKLFTGPGAPFNGNKPLRIPADFPDGASNTILVGEGVEVNWMKPEDTPVDFNQMMQLRDALGPRQPFWFFLMADASVKKVKPNVSDQSLKAAITANGQDVVGPDF